MKQANSVFSDIKESMRKKVPIQVKKIDITTAPPTLAIFLTTPILKAWYSDFENNAIWKVTPTNNRTERLFKPWEKPYNQDKKSEMTMEP